MQFIGQPHIINQLRFILPELYQNKAKGGNFLIRGRSGYGKTTLAHKICRYLAGSSYQVFNGEDRPFDFTKRVVFIDEIHTVPNLERFYHLMDAQTHVLVFATNHDGNLPEAFVNRCFFQFIFSEYDDDDLVLISIENADFRATVPQHTAIVKAANRNPRVISSLCKKLGMFFRQNPHVYHPELDFSKLIGEVLSIKDGLDVLATHYLDVLKAIGGVSSIRRLAGLLHVDEATLVNDVEPVLIGKGLITISSKGRTLTQ